MKVYGPWLAFGAYWGVWGASVPAVRDRSGVDDGALGVALLLVGLGALPAMAFSGRAIDRWGARVAGITVPLLGVAGVVLVAAARDFAGLATGLLVVGAVSGAADVAINAHAAEAERATARPVISRSHATFSAAVVLGSVLTGVASAAGWPVELPFVLVLVLSFASGAVLLRRPASPSVPASAPAPAAGSGVRVPFLPLVATGLVAALAFAVENAHQSWSAVFLNDALSAGAGLSAAAPAVFAAVASITRFSLGGLGTVHPVAVLIGGGTAAVLGTGTVAAAESLSAALAGLALAAAGTAVLYPTIIGAALAHVPDDRRGRATSRVATTAYLGFLAGPVYVGFFAGHGGLRAALLAVAALAVLFTLLAAPATRYADRRLRSVPAR